MVNSREFMFIFSTNLQAHDAIFIRRNGSENEKKSVPLQRKNNHINQPKTK